MLPSRSLCEWTALSTTPSDRRIERRAEQTRHEGDCETDHCTGSLQQHTLRHLTSRRHGNSVCSKRPCNID